MASASVLHNSGLDTLPAPLLSIINDENTQNTRFVNVMSCVGDLNAVAAFIRSELANKGDTIWDDEEQMGFLMNPVTHRLLGQSITSEPVRHGDIISEALRLGALIWIIQAKRRCRSYPGTAEARVSTMLQLLSNKFDAGSVWNSPDLGLVRLWLLVLCGISEPSDKDLATSKDMIGSNMKEPTSMPWDEIMAGIRQMPWVNNFEPPCAKLGQRLMKDYPWQPV